MPPGFLTTVAAFGVLVALALRPPRPRRSSPWSTVAALTYLLNEQPFGALVVLIASCLPYLLGGGPLRPLGVALAAVPAAGLVALAVRTRTARPALTAALDAAFGAAGPYRHHRFPVPLLLLPFAHRPGVRRHRNLRYGPAPGRGQLLDVYAGRHRAPAPVLIYLHGGGFVVGDKLLGGRPLLYRLASHGWLCVSANYRLRHVGYADRLADVKRVVGWVRAHAAEYGADPTTVVLAGGSAGAHLAATAAFTANDPRFQPGFEAVDTSVAAAIGLYGYYGSAGTDGEFVAAPLAHLRPDAPPFLVVHGALDTMVLVEDARRFVAALRRVATRPVGYAELPGTQHNFDFLGSLRFHAVLDGIEDFLDRALPGRTPGTAGERRS